MPLYKDPIMEKIFTNIQATLDTVEDSDGVVNSYHYGDPILIPKSELPALIIEKSITEIADHTTAEDEERLNMVLTYVVDIREYLKDAPENMDVGHQQLNKFFEERSSTDYTLTSSSLLKILRSNADLSNNAHIDLSRPMQLDYGFFEGKRGEKTISREATLSFAVYFTELRS